ncbi:hypothetical protein [Klebsiella pneumoniae]|uniref:hypothetical protein n=1 Tax=Klebsiella pneumoniae TaxID=573 RepID=UPI002041F92B|nr:hypothetical protein [Klebsiella pneumoniae]USB65930.1 hypothetical protein KU669_03465 [Klebsiella pneumoniae]HBT4923489.1 hypothetical protein [Klebsiella pneumoniae]
MSIEKILVQVERFKTPDGKVHNSLEEAEHHIKMCSGERIICPECNGTAKVDPYGDGREFISCRKCHAKGYLEKITDYR